jgi:hypothetical protein
MTNADKLRQMTELIDRQSALSGRKEYCLLDDDDFIGGYNTAIKDIREAIKELPTIDPEVRHGHWIRSDALDYIDPNGVTHIHGMCSCCKLIYDFWDMTSRFNFCPDCGARMDGGFWQ